MLTSGSQRLQRTLLAACLAALLVATGCGASGDTTVVEQVADTDAQEAGDQAPADEPEASGSPAQLVGQFETLGGDTVDLASLQGQDTVLWFWAPF